MNVKNREQLLALPGGRHIVQALETIEDDVRRSPQYIGSSTIQQGHGSPEGRIEGQVGDVFIDLDGSVGTTFYVKEVRTTTAPLRGWTPK